MSHVMEKIKSILKKGTTKEIGDIKIENLINILFNLTTDKDMIDFLVENLKANSIWTITATLTKKFLQLL